MKWPSPKRPLDILFICSCLVLFADILGPEFFGTGKSKDYPLWYWAGQQILHGKDLYPTDVSTVFAYIYPPMPAVLLAAPAYFGKIFLYVFLGLLNAVTWWLAIQFSSVMAGFDDVALDDIPGQWFAATAGFLTALFAFDNFDLGQPNLFLLMVMLYAFWLLERQWNWTSGALFAFAAAIKIFPVVVFPYLLWRRRWITAGSMAAFIGIFLVLAPAPIRGYERNLSELKTWAKGMAGSGPGDGFGQRAEQNWSYVNQSIIAVTHRLLRPMNYRQNETFRKPEYMNLLDLSYQQANLVLLGLCALIGLGFVAVMPPEAKRTRFSNSMELGILFCLMTVASPLAREYYFIWLLPPTAVLVHRAAYDKRPAVRKGTWAVIIVAFSLFALSLPVFPKFLQAIGNNLVGTALLIAGLVWHARNRVEPVVAQRADIALADADDELVAVSP